MLIRLMIASSMEISSNQKVIYFIFQNTYNIFINARMGKINEWQIKR